MANVDFTLDDVRLVVREEAGRVFDDKFPAAFNTAFDNAFVPAFEKAFEPYADAIQADFNQLHEELAEIKHEVAGHSQLLRQHSAEIMELKAHR